MLSTTYYVQTNLICLIILFIVSTAQRNKADQRTTTQLTFNVFVLMTALLCISDIFAWICNGKLFPGARFLNSLSNVVYYAATTVSGFAWLYYVRIVIRGLTPHRKKWLLIAVPLFVTLALLVINPLTNFFFSIDENNVYSRGPGIILHWIVSWGYLMAATVMVFLAFRKASSKLEKAQLAPLLLFILFPVLAAVVQMLFYGVTTTGVGMTISVIMISFDNMESQISNDVLTGLNNRRALDVYVHDQLKKPDAELTVMMCDVDRFKTINDRFGHAAGDLALKSLADALKRACGRSDAHVFLCRYGGDEFLICGSEIADAALDQLEKDIDEQLEKYYKLPDGSSMSVSVGRASGICRTEPDVDDLIRQADEKMYNIKEGKHKAKAE